MIEVDHVLGQACSCESDITCLLVLQVCERVYVCMCVYVCVCVYTCMSVCVCICMCVCVCVCVCLCEKRNRHWPEQPLWSRMV